MNTLEQRLLLKTAEDLETGCWVCGYYGRRSREAFQLWKGPIPEGLFVCHTCDNPKCINPEHLWLGTQKENMEDAVFKNRQSRVGGRGNNRGVRNGSISRPERLARGNLHGSKTCPGSRPRGFFHQNSKLLTEEQLECVKIWVGEGFSQAKIAKAFGVAQSFIGSLLNGKHWSFR